MTHSRPGHLSTPTMFSVPAALTPSTAPQPCHTFSLPQSDALSHCQLSELFAAAAVQPPRRCWDVVLRHHRCAPVHLLGRALFPHFRATESSLRQWFTLW